MTTYNIDSYVEQVKATRQYITQHSDLLVEKANNLVTQNNQMQQLLLSTGHDDARFRSSLDSYANSFIGGGEKVFIEELFGKGDALIDSSRMAYAKGTVSPLRTPTASCTPESQTGGQLATLVVDIVMLLIDCVGLSSGISASEVRLEAERQLVVARNAGAARKALSNIAKGVGKASSVIERISALCDVTSTILHYLLDYVWAVIKAALGNLNGWDLFWAIVKLALFIASMIATDCGAFVVRVSTLIPDVNNILGDAVALAHPRCKPAS